jgi:hypothetical protein
MVMDANDRKMAGEALNYEDSEPMNKPKLLKLRRLLKPPTATQWIIDKVLPEESSLALLAEEKSGKSWVAFMAALCVANGLPLFGKFAVKQQGKVLIYSPESSWNARTQRLWGLCWGMGLDPVAAMQDVYFIDGQIDISNKNSVTALRATIADLQPVLLIADPLISLHLGGDENSASEMQPLFNALRDLIQLSPGMSILVAHHLNKGHRDKSSFHKARGTSALGAWLDGRINITCNEKDDTRELSFGLRDGQGLAPCGFKIVATPHMEVTDSGLYCEAEIYDFKLELVDIEPKDDISVIASSVLSYVKAHPGETATQIGAALSRPPRSISNILSKLENKQLIRRDSKYAAFPFESVIASSGVICDAMTAPQQGESSLRHRVIPPYKGDTHDVTSSKKDDGKKPNGKKKPKSKKKPNPTLLARLDAGETWAPQRCDSELMVRGKAKA